MFGCGGAFGLVRCVWVRVEWDRVKVAHVLTCSMLSSATAGDSKNSFQRAREMAFSSGGS
jgi:hypothetical protein